MNDKIVNYASPTDELLNLAKEKWGLGDKGLKFIRGNENWVYEVDDFIFRFTGKYHRSVKEIQAELDWVLYLSEQGLSVSVPLKSKGSSFIEEVSDVWSCVVFKKAPGNLLKDTGQFTKEVFLSWGKLTGLIHKATRSFSPGKNRRHEWNKDDGYVLGQHALKNTDPSHPMVTQYVDLLKQINSYQKNQDC